MADIDILVVGAGPTGLALAAELRRLGVMNVALIDREEAGANTSRAAVVHARTLEVLESLEVTPSLIAQGIQVPIFRVRDRDRALITIDFGALPSRFPFTLMCPQDRTEQILLNRLQALGGTVIRPEELIGLSETTDVVSAELRGKTGNSTLRARWLVGCDGMHSIVRKMAGIPFEGGAYEQSFVLADVHLEWPLGRDEVSLFFSPQGLVVVAPLPDDRFRIVATVDAAPPAPSLDFMQALLDERGPSVGPARLRGMIWSSRFHIQHRVAQSPRRGRILLCGDAAHVHSPAGGQGMNTGIQDAVSLAAVLARGARDVELNEWAAERHRVASDVVALTDRMTRLATMQSSTGQLVRNAAIAFAGHIPLLRSHLASKIAELDHR